MNKLEFFKDGTLLKENIDLRNGKRNPFGWSQYEIYHTDSYLGDVFLGWLESGCFTELTKEAIDKGYTFKETKADEEAV